MSKVLLSLSEKQIHCEWIDKVSLCFCIFPFTLNAVYPESCRTPVYFSSHPLNDNFLIIYVCHINKSIRLENQRLKKEFF